MQPNPKFRVGDRLVYPNHGVVIVEHVGGSPIMPGVIYYHLRLLANNSRLLVPVENSERIGLRRLYDHLAVRHILAELEAPHSGRLPDWKYLYRENLERMKTGRLEDMVLVLKDFALGASRRSLAFREKKMYDRAKYILVSEIAIVRSVPEKEAEQLIERCLKQALGNPAFRTAI